MWCCRSDLGFVGFLVFTPLLLQARADFRLFCFINFQSSLFCFLTREIKVRNLGKQIDT